MIKILVQCIYQSYSLLINKEYKRIMPGIENQSKITKGEFVTKLENIRRLMDIIENKSYPPFARIKAAIVLGYKPLKSGDAESPAVSFAAKLGHIKNLMEILDDKNYPPLARIKAGLTLIGRCKKL